MTNDWRRERCFGLVGHGRIGSAVVAAWRAGSIPGWRLGAVLVRPRTDDVPPGLVTTRDALLATQPDVVIEVAGPGALAEHALPLLAHTEVWTVSAVALADAAFAASVETACRASGHRLRVLPGAIAGLDGVGLAAVDPDGVLSLDIELRPGPEPAQDRFEGSVREAARRFPDSVNVAAAAALAGPGLDAARIRVRHPGPVARNRLALHAEGRFGTVTAEVRPRVAPGVHPVAASVIAALRQASAPIWVG